MRSSTLLKDPWAWRYSTILSAALAPTRGRLASSFAEAWLMLTFFPATASELPEAESPDAHRIAATAKARRPEVREFIVDSFSNAFRSAGFEREIPLALSSSGPCYQAF